MKVLKPLLLSAALALAGTAGMVHLPAVAAGAAAPADYTDAEVRKIDRENRKITLRHGEIKNLDMPPMTMVFEMKDASALDKLKNGDKVRFKAVSDNGKLTVVEIQPAK